MKKRSEKILIYVGFMIMSVCMVLINTINVSAKAISNDNSTVCQCVRFILNTLLQDQSLLVKKGSWPNAASMATQVYWDELYKEYPYAGHYSLVKNPPSPLPGDIIIMQSTAHVYVKGDNTKDDSWQKTASFSDSANPLMATPVNGIGIGDGDGHIGFVLSAKYYNKNYNLTNLNLTGLSGWLIDIQSENWWWGTNDKTDINGCEVTRSTVFIPTGNPVSFWRKTPGQSCLKFSWDYYSVGDKSQTGAMDTPPILINPINGDLYLADFDWSCPSNQRDFVNGVCKIPIMEPDDNFYKITSPVFKPLNPYEQVISFDNDQQFSIKYKITSLSGFKKVEKCQ